MSRGNAGDGKQDDRWVCRACCEKRDAGETRAYQRPPARPGIYICADCGQPAPPEEIEAAVAAERERVQLELAVLQLKELRARRRRINENKRNYGKREAAELLGIDRSTTLENWIRDGLIQTVAYPDGVRIPRSEIERIEREGVGEPTPVRRRRARSRRKGPKRANEEMSASEAIKAIKV